MVSARRAMRPIVAIYPFDAIRVSVACDTPGSRRQGLPPLWPYPCRRECEAQSRRSCGQAPTHQAEEDDGPAGPRHPQEAAGGRTRPRPDRVWRLLRRSTRRSRSPRPTRPSRPRRRSSTTAAARRSSAPSTTTRTGSLDPALGDAADDAGRGRRRGEPDLLDRPGHRPQGHPAGGVLQRPRQRTRQGASTITQQYVKILYLTSEQSYQRKVKEADRLAQDPERAEQGRDPRGLPQHHLLRSRRVRRPGGGAGVLRQGRRAAQPARERGARHRPRTTRRATTPTMARRPSEALKERYGYVLDGDGRHWARSPRSRPRRPPSGCRSSPRSRRRASTAASAATCSRW